MAQAEAPCATGLVVAGMRTQRLAQQFVAGPGIDGVALKLEAKPDGIR